MRVLRGWLCAFFVTLATLGAAIAAPVSDAQVIGDSADSLSSSLTVEGAELLMGPQRQTAEEARRANPEAAFAREASDDAYQSLSPTAAKKLAGESFPGLIADRNGGPPQLSTDERLTGFVGPFVAHVEITGVSRENALIESPVPMATKTTSGAWSAVNLELREAEDGFEGTNSLVPARLPKHIGEGAQLPSIGLSVTPVDALGSPLGGAPGVIDGASEFVANTLTDADSVLKLSTYGFSIDTLLRSQDSPEQLSFRVALPPGAHLTSHAYDPGAVTVVSNGATIARMSAPSARDAAGTDVPVSVTLSGDTITLTVSHQAGEYLYPIAVDPEFNSLTETTKTNSSYWPFTHEGAFEALYLGEEMVIGQQKTAVAGNWGAFNYVTKGNSKIYEVAATTKVEPTQGNGTEYWVTSGESTVEYANSSGLESWRAIYQPWEHYTESPKKVKACVDSTATCAPGKGPEKGAAGNTVRFVLRATSAYGGTWDPQIRISTPTVSIGQPKETHSTVSYKVSSPEIEYISGGKTVKTANILYGAGGWLGPNSGAFEFESNDAGLGVSGTNVDVSKSGIWVERLPRNYLTEGCVGVQCSASQKEVVVYSQLSSALVNGNNTVRVAAHDPMASTWSYEHGEGETTLKVDAVAPHGITLSGLASKGSEYEIDEATGHLKVEATDGEGTTPSSGIKSLALAIDGKEIGGSTASCPVGPCTASGEWSLNGGEIGGGSHTLKVVVTDNANNVAEKEYSLSVHEASSIAMGPGSVNPESGNFELDATDVDISGGTSSLEVARSFDSRNPKAGAEGPLGPQWQVALGGSMASLEVLPDGSVTVIGPEGLAHFAKKSGGGFESPTGDANITLESVTKSGKITAYLLKSPAKGTTTTFTLPSGAKSWMPTVSEGPNATSTTTDEYTTAEPETGNKVVEPILEVAPHPSATCAYKKLEKGCRALEFNYAASTTATGEKESEWGDYNGHLTRVYFIAWDPVKKEMMTSTVAQYSYDAQGRLRAEWDPRISPALKTIYGYDSEGHVTAMTPPGQETWAFIYGSISGDATSGRLSRVGRAPASASLWNGSAPSNTATPAVSSEVASLGVKASVSSGTWSGSPVAYRYQWQRCNMTGEGCVAILGARNEAYEPTLVDTGHKLKVEVQAINGGGSSVAYSGAVNVASSVPSYQSKFGSYGTGSGQFKWAQDVALDASGNVWVTDTFNNRVEEFNSSGTFIREFGSAGTGNGQFKEPVGIAVTPEGNVWVADMSNNRLQEFSSTGTYIKQFGSYGTAEGQLYTPKGITITPAGNIWVADYNNNRVQEFSSSGSYIRKAGEYGTLNGQFRGPQSVASDASGDIWVTDTANNRVEEFSATGVYIRKSGSEGSGPGQFKEPRGITVDSTGEVWVTDLTNGRLQGFNANGEFLSQYGGSGQFNGAEGVVVNGSGLVYVADTSNQQIQTLTLSAGAGTVTYSEKFASGGSEAGQLSWPGAIALDASGNVWVADGANNRIQEFSGSGTYMTQFGTAGSGPGQFKAPTGIAFTSEGNMWVVDAENARLEEFEPNGKYIRQFGSYGSAAGQFKEPSRVAVMPETGHIWVSDSGNNRLEEFSATGEFVRQVTEGSGNGQFKNPTGLAVDSEHHVWVGDYGNGRVQELSATGEYIRQFGSAGGGRGQFNNPSGIAVDANGDIWVTDTFNDRIQVFTSAGEFLTEYGGWGTGNGQFYDPNGIAVSNTGKYYVLDAGWGRVQVLTAPTSTSEGAGAPLTEGAALTTIEYNVPVSGAGAPYEMGSSEVATWAQTDVPSRATAIFPADSPQGWPAPEYKRATVYYMDAHARLTNVATPGGGIETYEYNEYNEIVRSLSVANRAKALLEGAKSAEMAKLLDTQNAYAEEGGRLIEALGPQYTVKIAKGNEKVPTGSEVLARDHTKYYYNEGAPEGGEIYHLLTKTTNGAETVSKEEFDVRTSTSSYSGQGNLGWRLREPTSTTIDPAGLKIVHTTVYDEGTGAVVETRGPASTGAGNTHDMHMIYYSSAANGSYPACGEHVEWAGLPCESLVGKQPGTSGLPELPVTTTTYNVWNQPETITEAFGATTRTKKTSFDAADRPVTGEVTSTNGAAVPAVTSFYDAKTGALVEKSEVFEGKSKTIITEYNKLGQIATYTDSDGGNTTYEYDVDGRVTKLTVYTAGAEVRDTQTYTYNATTGLLTKLVDSGAGAFTATYDAAGNMLSETYPNKMTATYTINAIGQDTGVEYKKTAHCASTCPEKWFGDVISPSIHGEDLKQVSTLSEESKESYDAAGRLTEVQETPTGQGCTTRLYAYDEESNRTSLTTRAPGGEGKCATEGGSTETHSYDSANRLTDSGVSYETFGNITKLPAADAGGAGMEITSSYYVDGQVATQEQNGKFMSYYMDPDGRLRESRAPAVSVTHYAGPGSAVAWVSEPEAKWTVDIAGIDGSLSATKTSAGTVTLMLQDLQGNVVATAAVSETQTKLLTTYNSSEFGVPVSGTPPKYAWLGAGGVATESPTGLVTQGGISYVPQTGAPLQTQNIVLPRPESAATPYEMILAPWVQEGTAAMAKQRTAAEQAAEGTIEDPEAIMNLYSAEMKAKEFLKIATLAEVISMLDLPKDIQSFVEKEILDNIGINVVLGWYHDAGNKLMKCANNKRYASNITGTYKVNICRLTYDNIEFKVTVPIIETEVKVTFILFSHEPEVEECWKQPKYGIVCSWKVYIPKNTAQEA